MKENNVVTGFAHSSQRDASVEEIREQTKLAQDWLDGRFVDQPAYPIVYDGPPIVMRVTGHPPATASAVVRVFKPAFAVLARMAHGKLVVEDHWGASVHSDREGVAALRDGRSDLAPCYSGWDRQAYPLAQALQLPGLFPSSELATTIAEELYSKYFRADVERQGILMGRLKATGAFHLFSVEPIRSLAQLKGLRVGTSEGVDREVFHLLGAIPVSMSSLETRQALASGRIDAMHLPDGPAEVFGINEIARYRTAFGLLRHNVEFGMSAEFWRALPLDLKRVLNAWLRAEAQAETQIFYGLAGARRANASAPPACNSSLCPKKI
jgi:TRAP-type C4-dicarboxylate transport system substrate-binding protein